MSPNINDLNQFITAADVNEGDVLIFTNAGEIVERDYSEKQDGTDLQQVLQLEVELPTGKRKRISPNKTSRNAIAEKYGVNTENWVNKAVAVTLLKQNVRGSIRNVIYLEPVKDE